MARRALAVGVLFMALGFAPRPASAERILGGVLIATGGDVIVQYQGDFAGAQSGLFLAPFGGADFENPDDPFFIFINDEPGNPFPLSGDAPGTTVNLGDFAVGTVLVFGLHRFDNENTFFTGPAPGSGDVIPHALVMTDPTNDLDPVFEAPFLPFFDASDGILVGFEDKTLAQIQAEDLVCATIPAPPDTIPPCEPDFNDLIYSFTGVRGAEEAPPVPEPTLLLLFGTGAACVAVRRRNKK